MSKNIEDIPIEELRLMYKESLTVIDEIQRDIKDLQNMFQVEEPYKRIYELEIFTKHLVSRNRELVNLNYELISKLQEQKQSK